MRFISNRSWLLGSGMVALTLFTAWPAWSHTQSEGAIGPFDEQLEIRTSTYPPGDSTYTPGTGARHFFGGRHEGSLDYNGESPGTFLLVDCLLYYNDLLRDSKLFRLEVSPTEPYDYRNESTGFYAQEPEDAVRPLRSETRTVFYFTPLEVVDTHTITWSLF